MTMPEPVTYSEVSTVRVKVATSPPPSLENCDGDTDLRIRTSSTATVRSSVSVTVGSEPTMGPA